MKIISKIKTSKGILYAIEGECGILECLSMPNYGDDKKHVCAISVGSGCDKHCMMCDATEQLRLGEILKHKMATYQDLKDQIDLVLPKNWESKKKIKLHLTRMNEPTENFDIIEVLSEYAPPIIPNINTMMPNNNMTEVARWLTEWKYLGKYVYDSNINTQLSIHSVVEEERRMIFAGNAMNLRQIDNIVRKIDFGKRKPVLNFALCENWHVNAETLSLYFNSKKYVVKFTDLHETKASKRNHLIPSRREYQQLKMELEAKGFIVVNQWTDEEEDATQMPCGRIIEGIR